MNKNATFMPVRLVLLGLRIIKTLMVVRKVHNSEKIVISLNVIDPNDCGLIIKFNSMKFSSMLLF